MVYFYIIDALHKLLYTVPINNFLPYIFYCFTPAFTPLYFYSTFINSLEEYLHELEKSGLVLPNESLPKEVQGAKSTNFIEAALLLQQSSSVYSRKVEYLYTLVYSTLHHILESTSKSNNNNKTSSSSTTFDIQEHWWHVSSVPWWNR